MYNHLHHECRPGDNYVLQTNILNDDRQSVRDILDQVEWNQQSVNSFQNSIQSNVYFDFCVSKNVSPWVSSTSSLQH